MRAHHVVIPHAAFHAMEAGRFDQLKLGGLIVQDDSEEDYESEYSTDALAGDVVEFLREMVDE
ncbi:MAG TPA: hypothetical protein VK149_08370 [Sideroxyarcus sp.]|nr:hypothetical protein [Sideroxyarcus sp.]